MRPTRAWALGLVALAVLAGFSAYLSLTRIYQVDECQNIYMARVVATGQSAQFFTTSSLFLFGPLSWLTKSQLGSVAMFATARLVFLAVFWGNLMLMAWIASGRLFSTRGLVALIGAATLAPFWDYGIEIRHDNLILAGVLLTWALVRLQPLRLRSYVIAGGLAVAMLFIAVKSIAYAVPLSLAILVFPPAAHKRPGWQLRLAWIAGAILTAAGIRLAYGDSGAWEDYLAVFRGVSTYSAHASGGGGGTRFWPWATLGRLLAQAPLLLVLTTSGALALVAEVVSRGQSVFTWDGILPEALLVLGAFTALCINPTPYPYNLVHFAPYAFIFAFRHATRIWDQARSRQSAFWPPLGSAVLVLHLVPFTVATSRHLDNSNTRQKQLMRLSETLTDPATDRVYDGIGMVPTRPSVHYHWYLHSMSMGWFSSPGSHVRDLLAAQPPAVLIPSYRTDWLPNADDDFIKQRYVPLADDFLVLGAQLPGGGGSFEIFHPGRYGIVNLDPPATNPDHPFTTNDPVGSENRAQGVVRLDGVAIADWPVRLERGIHHIQTSDGSGLNVVWVGPRADGPPRLDPGNHQLLFRNWY